MIFATLGAAVLAATPVAAAPADVRVEFVDDARRAASAASGSATTSAVSPAAALAVSPVADGPTGVSVSYVRMEDWRDGLAGNYQRYDLRFTNDGAAAQSLSVCPPDAALIGPESRLTKRLVRQGADGIAFNGARISVNCGAQITAPGASAVLSVISP